MYKKVFYQSLLSGILAAVAGIIYYRIYYFATEADFSKVLSTPTIIGLNLAICLIAGFVYWALIKRFPKKADLIFNLLFSIISFAAVIIPISYTLPLKIQFPELFPGLAVPMVFFPAMAWYTVQPIFT